VGGWETVGYRTNKVGGLWLFKVAHGGLFKPNPTVHTRKTTTVKTTQPERCVNPVPPPGPTWHQGGKNTPKWVLGSAPLRGGGVSEGKKSKTPAKRKPQKKLWGVQATKEGNQNRNYKEKTCTHERLVSPYFGERHKENKLDQHIKGQGGEKKELFCATHSPTHRRSTGEAAF